MTLSTRNLLDRSFTLVSILSIVFMTAALFILLGPIFVKGLSAFFFDGTVEYRKMQLDLFDRGDKESIKKEIEQTRNERQRIYKYIDEFETELEKQPVTTKYKYDADLTDLKKSLANLFGPRETEGKTLLLRNTYGQTRWEKCLAKLKDARMVESWDYSNPDAMGTKVFSPRKELFKGTTLEPMFDLLNENNLKKMMNPEFTFYWRFLTDSSHDSHFYGGIWAEAIGTLYLTLGAMLFAIPAGVIAAIYLSEYAKETFIISLLRSCISTLAGVPSIVFGLFGLAFFINGISISDSKSVLAGSATLSLLVLPTIIRASEEAIKSVPHTYKEASIGLGATRWHTIVTVILPAALPGILTGIVISMGRAAGETAPIIFTAAVSVGKPLALIETLSQPTPALPWNIYNLCTEHEAVDEIRHVQYGMVLTLVAIVLLLNATAIIMRARISKKLRG